MTGSVQLLSSLLLLLVVLCPLTDSRADQNDSSGGVDSLRLPKMPDLPSPDSAARIESRHRVVDYPRLSVNGGIAVRKQDDMSLNETFEQVETSLDVSSTKEIDDSYLSFNLGLRIHISPSLSVWWEYYYGGSPSGDFFRVKSNTLIMLHTFEVVRSALLLSFGSGIAIQRLEAMKRYSVYLGSCTLKNIKVDTGHCLGWPLVLMIELRDPNSSSTPSLYVCGKFIAASEYSDTEEFYYESAQSIRIEAEMRGFWLTAGLQLTF